MESGFPAERMSLDEAKVLARDALLAIRDPGIDIGLFGADEINKQMRGRVKADYCAAMDSFAAIIDAILRGDA